MLPEIISTKFNKPLNMTDEEEQEFKASFECHICGQQYKEIGIRVRDH